MNREEYSDYIGKKYGHLLIQNIYSGEISGKKSKVVLCKCDCGNLKEVHLYELLCGKVSSCAECYKGTSYKYFIGKKYGHLLIQNIYSGEISGQKTKVALCKCDCGNIKEFKFFSIINNDYKYCGDCYNGTPYSSFIGKKYGLLTVQDVKKNMATVKCDCGNLTEVKIYHLLSGNNTSCGKCLNGTSYSSFIGKKYGYLTVINIESGKNGKKALCKCKCGNIKKVELFALLNGKTNSCGCFHKTFNYLKLVSFGKLHIMKTANNNEEGLRYICKCDCGNEIEVLESDLFTGKVTCCKNCNF